MERLWAPWRGGYVSSAGSGDACFLCAAAGGGDDDLVVARDATTITLLNRFPYNTGHLLVAPAAHVHDLLAAGDDGAAALMVGARRAMRALDLVLAPDGFNVGVNHGVSAGASVEHVHLHVVPRWRGDTNYMPVIGGTKVLPELLEETATRVRAAFSALD
jgi:ATP adenylyltransferase